jgi:hypothetical protein
MSNKLLDLANRVEAFEFTFDEITLKGTWFKWRTTTPLYQRDKAKKIAALQNVPEGASAEDAERILTETEAEIRRINAQVMKDTIKSWDAIEELPATLTTDEYNASSERLQKLYQRVVCELSPDDDSLGYTIINPADAEGSRPIPLDVDVFIELPTFFMRALGDFFQSLREQTVNPTKSGS